MVPLKTKTIRLEPEHHPLPVCTNFDDFDTVVAFEQAMRTHRAHVEAFVLAPLEARVDGAWQVSGTQGKAYTVDIVDGSGQHDSCTCPDFLGGELGLCKHVEAVRRAIRSRAVLHRPYQALAGGPSRPTLTVHTRGCVSLQPVGAWAPGTLAALGLQGKGARFDLRPDSPLLHPSAMDLEGTRLTHAVRPAVARLAAKAARRKRTQRFLQAFQTGKVGVDVLNKPLFPYQVEGVVHLAAQGRALLADDMGLGKTVQAIAACEVMRARGEIERVLIVTPASLKHQWAREIEHYSGKKAVVVTGSASQRAAALASPAPYKILSYELTWRELSRLQDLDTDVLILDEAQRAKNFRTKTASTLKAIPSRFLFVLTGTPIENRLDDLYSLLQLVDPEILGPLWRFNMNHHKQGPRAKVLGCKNLTQLRATIAPILLRRRKEAVLEQLPSLTEQTRYTGLSREQVDYEEGRRAEAAKYMALAERRPLTLTEHKKLQAALLKARQACNALELADPGLERSASPKLDEFEAYIAEIAAGSTNKILVFSEWVEMLKLASARLDKLGVRWLMLSGEVPPDKRPELLDRFRADGALQVLLSSDAGGVGLNLQVANYVVHLDLPWNPARLDQRTSRAHRLGQTRGVSVTYLCAEGGIERGIEGTLAGKRAVRAAALDQASEVETLETQSFTMFLRQLRVVLEDAGEPQDGLLPAESPGVPAEDAQAWLSAPPETLEEASAPQITQVNVTQSNVTQSDLNQSDLPKPDLNQADLPKPDRPLPDLTHEFQPPRVPPPNSRKDGRAQDRLRFAQVVLDAGFPGDAIKAAYESLAAAIQAVLDAPAPLGHDALVAAMYRDLLPSGRLPLAVPGVLARLHDLDALERFGVPVDPGLAREVLSEVLGWVARI
jgi:PHD/YefM family antitoxin component YafN of YafNO toxin-antitoxin module